jgi:hypothetical protein
MKTSYFLFAPFFVARCRIGFGFLKFTARDQ